MAYYVMYERTGSISLGHDSVATVALLSSRSDEHFKYWDLAGNSLPSSWSLQALGIIWESISGHSSLRMSVGSRRESDICTCVSKVSQSLVGCPLQGVPWEVPLDWILDGVGALEELFTGLLALRPLRGVHVLIQQLPEVVWHVQDLEVTGHPEKGECVSNNPKHHLCHSLESRLELAGHVAKVLGLPHHLADQLLLALKVVVVKLLVHLGKKTLFWTVSCF